MRPQVLAPVDVLFDALFGEERIVVHFDDVHPSVFIEAGVDRVDDIRFAGDELQSETVLDFEAFE